MLALLCRHYLIVISAPGLRKLDRLWNASVFAALWVIGPLFWQLQLIAQGQTDLDSADIGLAELSANLSSAPIFNLQTRYPFEMADVMRYQHQIFRQRVGGDLGVEHTDWIAAFMRSCNRG